jgi:hypothetical protein
MTPTEMNMSLDELGGRLLSNQGPPTRTDAKRLVDALRQIRAEHSKLQSQVDHMKMHLDRNSTCKICEDSIRELTRG